MKNLALFFEYPQFHRCYGMITTKVAQKGRVPGYPGTHKALSPADIEIGPYPLNGSDGVYNPAIRNVGDTLSHRAEVTGQHVYCRGRQLAWHYCCCYCYFYCFYSIPPRLQQQ